MAQEEEMKGKIRFKFRSGEEFEAEGNPQFIEQQRAYFLQLIGKPGGTEGARPELPAQPAYERQRTRNSLQAPQITPDHLRSATSSTRTQSLFTPGSGAATPAEDTLILPISRFPAAERQPVNIDLWDKLLKIEDGLVILRKKSKLLNAESAALLLIAAAKTLLKQPDGYSALHLSKSMKKSGYGDGRLDRTLTGELKAGSIASIGSKRSRCYKISDEGFARAFVLAEKISQDY